jgi:selenocysteine lyase/cysteine desulfurase
LTIVAAKVTETNDATEALNNVLKSLQDQWEKVDDKLAIGGLGFSALIVLWASTGLIGVCDITCSQVFFRFCVVLGAW